MVSMRKNRDTSLRRKPPSRSPRKRILIVCEGQSTEPRYFRCFQHDVHNPCVHVEISKETGVPLTVVQTAARLRREADLEAAQMRDENIRWDDVWAVFDIDEHPHVDQARALASEESIQLAISNPCFELWALLHFQDQRAHIHRHRARARLKTFMEDYDKALDYPKMRVGYADALRRAVELDTIASRNERPGVNPTTGVYRLTEEIRTAR